MNGESAYVAAKAADAQFVAFVMAAAQEFGQQETFGLLSATFDQYGKQMGQMFRQQLGDEEPNIENMATLVGPAFLSAGFYFEVSDQTENEATIKVTRCPLYDACQELGVAAKPICEHVTVPMLKAIYKTLNPNADYEYIKHRDDGEDHCLERVVIH